MKNEVVSLLALGNDGNIFRTPYHGGASGDGTGFRADTSNDPEWFCVKGGGGSDGICYSDNGTSWTYFDTGILFKYTTYK
jgi:hypothetical protein